MKFYIPFGDWSRDGHEHYDTVLVEAESMEDLLRAEKQIKTIYGEDFFKGYAEKCDCPKLSAQCWQALLDNNMPVSIFYGTDNKKDWGNASTLKEVLEENPDPFIDIEFVIDSFIWLLNQNGAEIKIIEEPYIPEINNWTCPGFETVGYGCYGY